MKSIILLIKRLRNCLVMPKQGDGTHSSKVEEGLPYMVYGTSGGQRGDIKDYTMCCARIHVGKVGKDASRSVELRKNQNR